MDRGILFHSLLGGISDLHMTAIKDRNRLLTLATKWVDKDHPDWVEISKLEYIEESNADIS